MEYGTIDIPPHYASGVGDSARSDIPSELWRGELGYLAAISPTVHRLALELIDRQARALAAVISDTTAVRPEIARLHGIALAGVFEIIISEAGRRTRDGQSQTKSLGSYRESSTIFSKNSTTGSAYRSHHAASRRGAVGRELTDSHGARQATRRFTHRCYPPPTRTHLQQLAKRLHRQPRIPYNAAHRVRVDGILPRDRQDAHAVGHHDVLPLPHNSESRLLKCPHRVQMIDARDLRHRSARDFDFADRSTPKQILARGKVFADGVPDILQCLILRRSLRPTARQSRNRDAVALIPFLQSDLVLH